MILVAYDPDTPDVTDDVLYVGASRAVTSLTVIGPSQIGERSGLSVLT